ncbi:MAG TPA: DUF5801 repeats-in-toxin domain-containing protein, partial [Legionella sp.]|nr:DUF5801 repeats-in-toxin domain-containing protein [Legionella sp.]
MIIPTLGAVQTLQGLLAKIDLNGHTSIIRQGSTIEPGESVVLLSGSSQLNLFNNLPIIDLAINQPFSLDGISPLLKAGNTEVIQQLIEDALIKGLDISQLLAALEATAAGDATVLGSGGNAYILDPMFGFGLVTAGYDTRGLSSLNAQETDYVGNMVQLYGNTKPEAYLAFSDNDLSLDESLTVRNGDFNAGDQNGIVDPFNFGQVIGFAEGFLVSAASSQFNQPADRVTSSYALELGNGASSLKASNGSPITLSLDGNKIIATSEGKVIFAIGIDPANGKITIVQYHGIYHPNANSADESIDLSNLIRITLTLTDSSGDKSTASLDIGSKIHFEDDAPFMHGVDSIQLNDNTNIGLVITGSVNVDFNTDLAKDLVFADSALNALRTINLTSNGQALFFSMDEQAHTITATNEAQQVIFTLTLSEVRANHVQTDMPHYELHVYESIDQPLNNEITISIPIKAIDADNDSVIGNLVINIDDGSDAEGGISTSFIAVEGDLDAITGGYPVTTNHQFSITAGIDRLVPESLTIDSGFLNNLINEFQNEVTASGSALTLTQNSVNGVITLTATDTQNNTVFQLIITPQNSGKDLSINVTLIQYKPLDHDASGDSTGLIRQDGQSLHIDLQLQAQDSDGDALTNPVNLKVTINDGGAPALGNHQLIFTENLTTQTQSGQVPLNLGSDVISTLVFENTATMQNSLNDLTSGGKQTSYSFESDNKVLVLKIDDASSPLNGQEILRVTINPDGSYTATLSGPLDQVNEISELLLDVRATDKDGDSSNLGQIKIIINDAVNQPYPTQASTNIVEGDLSPGTYPISSPLVNFTLQTSGDRLLPETVKFDPATINTLIAELNQEIKFDGQPLTFTVTGNTITGSLNGVDILVIELTANQNTNNYDVDAHIKVTLNAPIDHNQNNSTGSVHLQGDQINIILGVQIQDAEGDYLAQPALINAGISDGANPVLSTQESININEPVTGAATIGQASFVIDIGSDPIDHLGFNYTAGENSGLKSAGHDVLFEVDNGVLKGYYLDGSTRVEVLRATLSNNTTSGQVHFELFKPLDHSQLGQDSLSLNLKIQAIDTDGDSANLTLPVNIVDSIAHPVGGVATVIEGETVTGSLAGFYNLNAEGGHLYSVVVENTTYSFANNQTTYVINTAKGELTINSDGTWKLVSVDGLDHDFTQELVVGYSVIDGDGDISPVNNLVIGINDGAPSTGGQTLTTGLNEGDLAPITYPTHVLSPSLTLVNNGSDPFDLSTLAILNQANLANELQNDIKFFSITTGQEESVVATVTNDTITLKSASGELVLEIKLIPVVQPNGDILLQQDITLYQPLSQLIANSGGSVQIIGDQIRITYGVQVIDIDGDALTNPVTISALINDGVNPDLINTVATSVIDGSNQTNGNLNLNIGSDPIATITFNSSQPLLSGLTSNGFATTQEVSAHSVKIFDSNHNLIVEITVADNGAYTVQINGPLDQGIGNILAIPLNVTVVDKDGDQDTALLTVNIV